MKSETAILEIHTLIIMIELAIIIGMLRGIEMKNLREAAERIFEASGSEAESIGKENILNAIESVLKEVEEAIKEARSSALAEAALIVEKEHKFCEPPMCEIANKIRALMGKT